MLSEKKVSFSVLYLDSCRTRRSHIHACIDNVWSQNHLVRIQHSATQIVDQTAAVGGSETGDVLVVDQVESAMQQQQLLLPSGGLEVGPNPTSKSLQQSSL